MHKGKSLIDAAGIRANIFSRRGQTLIEALVALTLLSVGFLSIFALLGRSMSSGRASAESYTATYLAAEGIEVARNLIDANGIQKLPWNNGFTTQGDYEIEYNSNSLLADQNRFLTYDPTTNIYNYSGTVTTPFKRIIRVTPVGSDEIMINSIVNWTSQGSGNFTVNLEDNFLKWRQ
ncbi:MAG TPA: prepilin-type N-terminal cleavage/methylation domain-containing protein [Candidatus Paceibacterota bacterium]|nr:prepilin-type N-terminal cleavage/methylation domain-containing protein [Candidatus Paceibacterota bacterium]